MPEIAKSVETMDTRPVIEIFRKKIGLKPLTTNNLDHIIDPPYGEDEYILRNNLISKGKYVYTEKDKSILAKWNDKIPDDDMTRVAIEKPLVDFFNKRFKMNIRKYEDEHEYGDNTEKGKAFDLYSNITENTTSILINTLNDLLDRRYTISSRVILEVLSQNKSEDSNDPFNQIEI